MKLKEVDEKGYFLLESLTALAIVSLILLVYAPFMGSMLQTLDSEKMEVEMTRLLYDSARKESKEERTVKKRTTGQWTFDIVTDLRSTQKGVYVHDASETKEETIQILSIQYE